MKLENTGIEGTIIDIKPLSLLMGNNAFIKGEGWDYERVTYDYKIDSPEKNITYYIRIQAHAIEGNIDTGNAVVKLLTPIIGKHYYPHGIEYGPENFTEAFIERATSLVLGVQEDIVRYQK